MPGEAKDTRRGMLRRLYDTLRSQGFGIICGLAAVVLLGLGSVVLTATRDGASAGIQLDDIRPFFERPSWVHSWFYALLVVFSFYGLSTLLATWHSFYKKWSSGRRRITLFGSEVIHISFLVALLAHLVGGLWSEELGVVALDGRWRFLPDGREARVLSLNVSQLPSGTVKQASAQVEVRGEDGRLTTQTVEYNQPLSRGFGSTIYLLLRYAHQAQGVTLHHPDGECTLVPKGPPCKLGQASLALLDLRSMDGRDVANISLSLPQTGQRRNWALQGTQIPTGDGQVAKLHRFEHSPTVLLRGRRAAGSPPALVSALLLVVGLGLMWRRLFRRLA